MIPKFRAYDGGSLNRMYQPDEVMVGNGDIWIIDEDSVAGDWIRTMTFTSCNQQVFVTRKVQKFLKVISYIIRYRQNIPLLSSMTKTKVAGTATV